MNFAPPSWKQLVVTALSLHVVVLLLQSWWGMNFIESSIQRLHQQQLTQTLVGTVQDETVTPTAADINRLKNTPGIASVSLVRRDGSILSSSPDQKRSVFTLRNIRQFLSTDQNDYPVFGEDPNSWSSQTLFTVVPIEGPSDARYLYVTADRDYTHSLVGNLKREYVRRTIYGALFLQGAILLGLLCFGLLWWKRLHREASSVLENVSHDLRGPLGTLRIYLETLQGSDPNVSPEQREEFLRTALTKVDKVSDQIHSLMNAASAQALEQKAQKGAVSLPKLCEEIVATFHPTAEAAEVDLRLSCMEQNAVVYADRDLLSQAIVNLVENAIQYTPAGGTVMLSITRRGDTAVVKVADTGIGIPASEQERIFHRFYRGDQAQAIRKGGSGIGLALVRNVLRLHDSEITLKSYEQHGSTFSFSLPFIATEHSIEE